MTSSQAQGGVYVRAQVSARMCQYRPNPQVSAMCNDISFSLAACAQLSMSVHTSQTLQAVAGTVVTFTMVS